MRGMRIQRARRRPAGGPGGCPHQVASGGPDSEANGVALCALHHKLFDRGAFTLSKDMKIQVSEKARQHLRIR